jgi:CheY-like chemotaxis protein
MIKIIFMIDDDEDDRDIFRDAILHCNPNIDLLFARDGLEALDILKSSWVQPDAIFLDYNMPRMNGVECLKELKSAENTREIPVVMYTTLGDRAQENVILKLGADYYMRKTYSFDELCTELHRLLDVISQKEVKSARK